MLFRSISILRDRAFDLSKVKSCNYILIKNNIKNTTSGKLRFLISDSDYKNILEEINEASFLNCLRSMPQRLGKITGLDEIKDISSLAINDPLILGNPQKYFVIYLNVKTKKLDFTIIFVIRDEMLLFPLGRISSDYALNIPHHLFKKAFIELDKNIIWDGMNNWGTELSKKMSPFIKEYSSGKQKLMAGDSNYAYLLVLEYLLILKQRWLEKL